MWRRVGNETEDMPFSFIRGARHALQHGVTQYGMGITPIHAIYMQTYTMPDRHTYALCPIIRPSGRHP
ncbi:hypothetical protein Gain_0035_028 [Komagataeibacter intermedius TF2]|nr:hypothetical protein Gain_0035_028 [Komagataeibacter intermedius TF2]